MKREIKFRAFQDNEMLMQPISGNYAAAKFLCFLYEDTTIMQFTGLKDKNGKEIYEGDIVSLIATEEHKMHTQMCGIRCVEYKISHAQFFYNDYIPMNWGGFESVEIIGNIYTTPELLK